MSRQRIFASLLALGAGILLFRTLRMMLVEGAFELLVPWVFALLIAEFLLDLSWGICSIRWFIHNRREKAVCALRLATAAIFLHALRVGIFVLGRTGPWINFDVKPEHHPTYTFEWFWVYFASILSVLSVTGVIIIRGIIRRNKRTGK